MELTREQIEQMPAGREMDALIAEKVLGHVIAPDWPCGIDYDSGQLEASMENPSEFPGIYNERHPVIKNGEYAQPMPFYSTDIAAAWQVLVKAANSVGSHGYGRKGYRLDEVIDASRILPLSQCQIGLHKATAEQDEMPLAICRAALLAHLSHEQ